MKKKRIKKKIKNSIAGNRTRGTNVRGLYVTNYTTMDCCSYTLTLVLVLYFPYPCSFFVEMLFLCVFRLLRGFMV